MKRTLIALAAVLVLTPSALAICGLPGPGLPPSPGRGIPSGPGDTPTPGGPGGPVTPGGPGGAPPSGGGIGGGSGRRAGRGVSWAPSWNIWWELNREYIFGLRKARLSAQAVSGSDSGVDPAEAFRAKTRKALRAIALDPSVPTTFRATALRALGRAGVEGDAEDLLRVLRTPNQSPEVCEGAAIGLASLREIEDERLRELVRCWYDELLAGKVSLPGRAELVAVLSAGLRARDDEAIARSLAIRLERSPPSANEAAAILFACGLSRSELLTEGIEKAAVSGKLGRKKLHDIARAHSVLALAMCGGGKTARTLAELLVAKKVQVHTRRSTALALGLLLREGSIDGVSDQGLQKALHYCFEKENDPLVKGYCAIAMGAAKRPFLTGRLVKLVDKTGSQTVRPYAAVALGLAARTMGREEGRKIREFLVDRLPAERDLELAAALTIAIGLSGATEAEELLTERATAARLIGSVRGPACQALGMLQLSSPGVLRILREGLSDNEPEVVEDAALALGFLGRSGTGPLLVEKLLETRSPAVRVHMVVALSHLGGTEAIDPLLEVLGDPKVDHLIRGSAASALGILLDPRERDPLFEIDAYASPYGLTAATRELVRIY